MCIQVLYPFLNWLVCFLSLSFRSFSLYSGCMRAQSCLFETTWIAACRLLGPWNFPGKNTGVSCRFLLQGILTQGSNPRLLCLLHWQADSLPPNHLIINPLSDIWFANIVYLSVGCLFILWIMSSDTQNFKIFMKLNLFFLLLFVSLMSYQRIQCPKSWSFCPVFF